MAKKAKEMGVGGSDQKQKQVIKQSPPTPAIPSSLLKHAVGVDDPQVVVAAPKTGANLPSISLQQVGALVRAGFQEKLM
jgi:hypothetical protein